MSCESGASEMKNPKIVITGYARHGKDTVCEILRDNHNYSFESSSHVLAEEVVYPYLAPIYGYNSIDECYADRVNHRKEWFDILVEYNTPDLTRLGRKIFEQYDIYCGLRNVHELHAMRLKGMYDLLIWVDAFDRVGTIEGSDSMSITPDYADIILFNNGSLYDLVSAVDTLALLIKPPHYHITKDSVIKIGAKREIK